MNGKELFERMKKTEALVIENRGSIALAGYRDWDDDGFIVDIRLATDPEIGLFCLKKENFENVKIIDENVVVFQSFFRRDSFLSFPENFGIEYVPSDFELRISLLEKTKI